MTVAKRDDNGSPTLIGVSSTDNTTPLRARADPVTGYILAEIKPIVDFATTSPKSKPDDNGTRVIEGVTNDSNQTVRPILSDPNNQGYVLADVILV